MKGAAITTSPDGQLDREAGLWEAGQWADWVGPDGFGVPVEMGKIPASAPHQ